MVSSLPMEPRGKPNDANKPGLASYVCGAVHTYVNIIIGTTGRLLKRIPPTPPPAAYWGQRWVVWYRPPLSHSAALRISAACFFRMKSLSSAGPLRSLLPHLGTSYPMPSYVHRVARPNSYTSPGVASTTNNQLPNHHPRYRCYATALSAHVHAFRYT